MRTYYKENLISTNNDFTYSNLSDKPSISGLVLKGNSSAEQLDTFNIPTVDRLVNDNKNIVIDSILPQPEDVTPNTLYYIGSMPPFAVYLSDTDSVLTYLGMSSSQSFSGNSEGILVNLGDDISVISAKFDDTMYINEDGKLAANLVKVDEGEGLRLRSGTVLDVHIGEDGPIREEHTIQRMAGAEHSPFVYGISGTVGTPLEITSPNTVVKMRFNITPGMYLSSSDIACLFMFENSMSVKLVPNSTTDKFDLLYTFDGEHSETVQNAISKGVVYDLEAGNNYVKLNNKEIGRWTPRSLTPGGRMWVFGSTDNYYEMIYNLRIYDGATVIGDFVPALSSVTVIPRPGLFDIVSGQFIQGTGDGMGVHLLPKGDPNFVDDNVFIDSKLYCIDDYKVESYSDDYFVTKVGLVPKPKAGEHMTYLRDDGIWDELPIDYMIGEIKPYAGSVAPPGWLLCDGSRVDKVQYHRLYKVIGDSFNGQQNVNANALPTSYGDTFALPDLRQRYIKGADATNIGKAELPTAPRMATTASTDILIFWRNNSAAPEGTGALKTGHRGTEKTQFKKGWGGYYYRYDYLDYKMSYMNPEVYRDNCVTIQPDLVVTNYIIKY